MDVKFRMRIVIRAGVLAAFVCIFAFAGHSQEVCLSPERISELTASASADITPPLNTALQDEILKLHRELNAETLAPRLRQDGESPPAKPRGAQLARMCEILRSQPWPVISSVGADAASAWIALVKMNFPADLQVRLLPIINAAVDKGRIRKDIELATFIDRLRVTLGLSQLFGTQAVAGDGFLTLWPMLSEEKADEWRTEYGMIPFKENLRGMQLIAKKPLIRSTARTRRVPVETADPVQNDAAKDLLRADEAEEPAVRVDTALVRVDATVYGAETEQLKAEDFRIFEDGAEQKIVSFNSSDTPFDIVLLLDLSGSTAGKTGLIRRATRRFIEMKREVDRVAIVTFTSEPTVVVELESDKKKLLGRVSKIKGFGASHVWDALASSFDMLRKNSSDERRKAVVLMSDGAENALTYIPRFGSQTLFADLVEEVRNGSFSVFPIYLDTETDEADARLYADARRTLQLLADESGGNFYRAEELEKLEEVYGRVLKDVGRVYSIGYEPANSRRDGAWRSIRVELPSKPGLRVRARPGYYAK
ncbi:MAG: VWA domain-containing protein [Pyrinomonadaceae bacterium]|nr:VWA domain-containing protein [Pyrinomonadaceae bacterium]